MNTMNSMQRTLTTLGQKEPDRVPLFLLTSLHGAQVKPACRSWTTSARADNVIEGQMRLLHKYGGDCLYPFFYAAIETEAWGGDTIFSG
jgi:uroporphyrinogen decarboxylase